MDVKDNIISQQKKLETIFESHDYKLDDMTKKQTRELRKTLNKLRKLHEKPEAQRFFHSWQECLGHYELLKAEGKKPDERDIGANMGLKDMRLKGRNWLEVIREKGYNIELAPHIPKIKAEKERKKEKLERVYAKMRKEEKDVTLASLAEEASMPKNSVIRYAGELKLRMDKEREISKEENIEKVLKAYEKLDTGMIPNRKELAQETGFCIEYVRDVCKSKGLPLMNADQANKKIVYNTLKKVKMSHRFADVVNDVELHKLVTQDGHKMHLHTVKRWRKQLEKEGQFKISKARKLRNKDKYSKYEKDYIDIITEKLKEPGVLSMKSISEELSRRFGEEVPYQRLDMLRKKTGLPKTMTNDDRYRNIVKVYRKNPGTTREEWANLAHVSVGFLSKAIRDLCNNEKMTKKFRVPESMGERFHIVDEPLLKTFKALGNTNRVMILKAISKSDELMPEDITDILGYNKSKWQTTINYHLRVLENAGFLMREDGKIMATQKTEILSEILNNWDIGKIVPEEIFGPGYNKPLFVSKISKKPKSLKKIVKEMREQKGRKPFMNPSSESSERHPVHDDLHRRKKFKKYLRSKFGVYDIKGEYLDLITSVIDGAENASLPENLQLANAKKEVSSTQYIRREVRERNLNYLKLRKMVESLVLGSEVYQGQYGLSGNEALRYMNFIKDNYTMLCKVMKFEPTTKTLVMTKDELSFFLKNA